MKTTPDYEGIRTLAAIIDGMPDDRFDLTCVVHTADTCFSPFTLVEAQVMHECGTTACALGVVCLHPDFADKGLRFAEDGYGWLMLNGMRYTLSDFYIVGAEVFGLSTKDAWRLFGSNHTNKGDKAVFKERVIAFLRSHGQPINSKYLA